MVEILDRSLKQDLPDVRGSFYIAFDAAAAAEEHRWTTFDRSSHRIEMFVSYRDPDERLHSAHLLRALTSDDSSSEPADLTTEDDFEI